MIELRRLSRRFGDVTAVDSLSFTVDEGQVFGLLGPNGAGKTTTVRMLSCLIGRSAGEARVAGLSISDPEHAPKIRGLVGLLPEDPGLYPELSPRRTLDFFGRLHRVPKPAREERIERLLTMLGLWEWRDSRVATFSKGMKQRLAMARTLIHDPPVLLLDEPTANLDPEGAKSVRDFLLELRREKRTILLSTHRLEEADRICDRIGIVNKQLVALGRPAELRESLWGHTTVIELDAVTSVVVAAVRRVHARPVEVVGNSLVLAVREPERENPDLVSAVVGAGGRVRFVSQVVPTLEDVYLKLLRGMP